MAKRPKRTIIGGFDGQRDDVNGPSLPDNFAEFSQNIRLDKTGALISRYGFCPTRIAMTPNECYSLSPVDLNGEPCVVMHTDSGIFIVGIGIGVWVDGATTKYKMLRSAGTVPDRATYTYENLLQFTWQITPGTPSFTSANVGSVSGNYVSVSVSTSIPHFIYGAEMIVDNRYHSRAAFTATSPTTVDCSFSSVFIAGTATNWQFRYVGMDGSRGPLSASKAIPYP